MSNAPDFIVVDPRGRPATSKGPRLSSAPRPKSLEGATVAVIANGSPRVGEIMEALAPEIEKFFHLGGVVRIAKATTSEHLGAEDIKRLAAEASGAVIGVGV